MRFGGSGWKPDNRRSRRQNRAPQKPAEEGADRTLLIVLAVFALAAFGLVLLVGILGA